MSGVILIIEDEADIAETLAFNLEREGFKVKTALDGEAGLDAANADPRPDLILLDLMLPDIPGTEVCRRLRQSDETRRTPILMLTAKTDPIDRVVGFEVGADDYVTKPFSTREVILRIKAILRRSQPDEPAASTHVRFGRLALDIDGHRVWVDDLEVGLTALEFRLLTTLIARKGRVQTRETLLNHVWEMSGDVTTRTVDTHVRRLRKKLGPASAYIETIRGVGYRFLPDAPAA